MAFCTTPLFLCFVRQASPRMEDSGLPAIQSVQTRFSAPCASRRPKPSRRFWLPWHRSRGSTRDSRSPRQSNSWRFDLPAHLPRTCPVSCRTGRDCNITRRFADQSRPASDNYSRRSHRAGAPACAPTWRTRGISVPVRAAPRGRWQRRQAFSTTEWKTGWFGGGELRSSTSRTRSRRRPSAARIRKSLSCTSATSDRTSIAASLSRPCESTTHSNATAASRCRS